MKMDKTFGQFTNMNRAAKDEPFSKQSEFRALTENIQSDYIGEKGWPSEWFLGNMCSFLYKQVPGD